MTLLAERESDLLRVRLLACGCGHPDCRDVFVLLTMRGAHEDLWIGVAPMPSLAAAEFTAADILENPDARLEDGPSVRELTERRLAIVGMPWEALLDRHELHAQIAAWVAMPDWMERLPAGDLWQLRRCVFGRDQTRVIRALFALHCYYAPDLDVRGAGVRPGELEQPWSWARQHPETPARVEDMRDA